MWLCKAQRVTKLCSPGSALLWPLGDLNPYPARVCRLALPGRHKEEGGRGHPGRTPKEVWEFALHPLSLHEGELELGSAAEPGTAVPQPDAGEL